MSSTSNSALPVFSIASVVVLALDASEAGSHAVTALRRRGHQVVVQSPQPAPTAALDVFDLVVYEPNTGQSASIRFCQALREFTLAPVLVLVPTTARSLGIQGLELGADTFMLIPFDRRELVARAEALVRRYRNW